MKKAPALALLLLHSAGTLALEIRFDPVVANVCAYIGDSGARTVGNQGLNANLGLVVTAAGRGCGSGRDVADNAAERRHRIRWAGSAGALRALAAHDQTCSVRSTRWEIWLDSFASRRSRPHA